VSPPAVAVDAAGINTEHDPARPSVGPDRGPATHESDRDVATFVSVPQQQQRTPAGELVSMALVLPQHELDPESIKRRAQGTDWLLAYVARFPGETWQQRWVASGLEDADPRSIKTIVCHALGLEPTLARAYRVSAGLGVLLSLDVVRPGFDYVHRLRLNKLWAQLIIWRQDPDGDLLQAGPGSEQSRSHASGALGRLLLVTGRPIAQLTAEDVLTYRQAVLQRHTQSLGLEHLWNCLQQRGQVEGTLRQALRPGQKSVTELVDNYPIRSTRVRGLLIAYLTERSLTVDYSTLRALVANLCHLYWLAVEAIAPGIDTIDLPAEVATAWKTQLRSRQLPDGQRVPRRNAMNVLMSVRGFYADLLQLTHDDPARWAEWPCTPPVSANEVKRYHKWRSQLRSEMHERTRVRTVKVADLADAAERSYHHARSLYDAAHALPSGGRVTVAGVTYLRADAATHPLAHPRLKTINPDGTTDPASIDVVQQEEDAFWGLAVVEVLRHTGIRIEEMLELTQLDVHEYEHRDPSVRQGPPPARQSVQARPRTDAGHRPRTRRHPRLDHAPHPTRSRDYGPSTAIGRALRLRRMPEQRTAALLLPTHSRQGIQRNHPPHHSGLRRPRTRQSLRERRPDRRRRHRDLLHRPRLSARLCDRCPRRRTAAAHHPKADGPRLHHHHTGLHRDLPRRRHPVPSRIHPEPSPTTAGR
jgi:hypothetical protein